MKSSNISEALLVFMLLAGYACGILQESQKPPCIQEKPQSTQYSQSEAEHAVCEGADSLAIQQLLEHGQPFDMRIKPSTGMLPYFLGDKKVENAPTLLMYAAYYGNQNAVSLLLQKGADINTRGYFLTEKRLGYDDIEVETKEGITPLQLAAWNGQDKTVALLLAKRARLEAVDSEGKTALMQASLENHLLVMRLLLKRHAGVNRRDKQGRTALMHAVEARKIEAILLLLQTRCDVNARDNKGVTALKLAAQTGSTDIYQRLKKAGAKGNEVIQTRQGLQP